MNSKLTLDCLKVANLNQFGGPENEKPKLRKKLLDEGLIKCNTYYDDNNELKVFKNTPYRLTDEGKKEDKFEYSNNFCAFSVVIVFIISVLYFMGINGSTMLIALYISIGVFVVCSIGRVILHYRNPLRHFRSSGFISQPNRPRSDDPNKDFSSRDDD
jgi:hypothetical protein